MGTSRVLPAVSVVASAQPQAKWPARTMTARLGPTGAMSTSGSLPAGAEAERAPWGSLGTAPWLWLWRSAQVVPVATLAFQPVTVRCPRYVGAACNEPNPCWLTETVRSALAPGTPSGSSSEARTWNVVDCEGACRSTEAVPGRRR